MKHVRPFTHDQLLKRENVFNGMVSKGLRGALHTLKVDVLTAAGFQPDVPPGAPPPAPYTPQALAAVTAAWNAQVSGELFPFLVDTFADAAQSTAKLTSQALGLSLDPLSDAWAANYLAFARNRLVGIGDAVWRQMSAALEHGYAEGQSVVQMAHALQQTAQLSLPRALTIARTEVISAANAGGFQQLVTAGFTSDECRKEWLATDDARTREAHHKADGQMVGLLEAFQVDGEGLMFPGDPHGSPGNVINCRCSTAYAFTDDAAPQQTNVDDLVTASVISPAESYYDPSYLDMILGMSNEQLSASSWGPAQEKMHPRDNDGKFTEHPGGKLLHTLESLKSGGEVKAWTKVVYTTKYDHNAVVAVRPIGDKGKHAELSWDASKKQFKITVKDESGKEVETPNYVGKGEAYKHLKDQTGWHLTPKTKPGAGADATVAKIDKVTKPSVAPGSTTKPSPPSSPGMMPSVPSSPSTSYEPGSAVTKGWIGTTHKNDDIIAHANATPYALEQRAVYKYASPMGAYIAVEYKSPEGDWKHLDTLSPASFFKLHVDTGVSKFSQDWVITTPDGKVGASSFVSVSVPSAPSQPGDKVTKAWLTTPHNSGDIIMHADANPKTGTLEKRAVYKHLTAVPGLDPYIEVQYKSSPDGEWLHYDSQDIDTFYAYNVDTSKAPVTQQWVVTDTHGNTGSAPTYTSIAPPPSAPATPKAPAAAPKVTGYAGVKGAGSLHVNTKVIYTTKYTHGAVVAVQPDKQQRIVWNDKTKKFEYQAVSTSTGQWTTLTSYGKGEAYKKFKDETGWKSPATGEGRADMPGSGPGDATHAPSVSGNPTAPTITVPAKKTGAVKPSAALKVPATVAAQLMKAFGDTSGFSPAERDYIITQHLGIAGGQQMSNLTHTWVTDQQAFYALANRLNALHQDKYPNLTLLQLAQLYDEKYPPKPGNKSILQRTKDYLSTPPGKAYATKYAAGVPNFNPLATGLPPTPEQQEAIKAAQKAAAEAATKKAAAAKKVAEAAAKKVAEMKANFPVSQDISTPETRPLDAAFPKITHAMGSSWYQKAKSEGHWNSDQMHALKVYTGSGYHSMNGALRGDSKGSDETWKNIVNLQAMMVPVPADVQVYRGSSHEVLTKALGTSSFADVEKHIGAVIQDEGFLSTSISPDSAFGGSVRYEIQVPKGTAALYVSPDSAVGQGERELLLAAGTKFQIIGIRKKGEAGTWIDTVIMRAVKA